MIGGLLAFAHLSLDPGIGAARRERFAREDRVDTQSTVFRKGKHPVIPPGEQIRLLVMQTERVVQTRFTQLLKGGALAVGAHDRAPPQRWIVDVALRAHRAVPSSQESRRHCTISVRETPSDIQLIAARVREIVRPCISFPASRRRQARSLGAKRKNDPGVCEVN